MAGPLSGQQRAGQGQATTGQSYNMCSDKHLNSRDARQEAQEVLPKLLTQTQLPANLALERP